MISHAKLIKILVGLSLVVSLGGCHSKARQSWGAGGGSFGWNENGMKTSYALGRLFYGGEVFAVVMGCGCIGSSHRGGDGQFHCQLQHQDGSKIDWSCRTDDGKSGAIRIERKEFDLSRGGLFLVFIKQGQITVDQVPLSTQQLESCSDLRAFRALATVEQRISDFLANCETLE
jgi:hypothetical protein